MQLCGLRNDYLNAMDRMERDRASQSEATPSEGEINGVPFTWARSRAVHPERDSGTGFVDMSAAADAGESGDMQQDRNQQRGVGEADSVLGRDDDVSLHRSASSVAEQPSEARVSGAEPSPDGSGSSTDTLEAEAACSSRPSGAEYASGSASENSRLDGLVAAGSDSGSSLLHTASSSRLDTA